MKRLTKRIFIPITTLCILMCLCLLPFSRLYAAIASVCSFVVLLVCYRQTVKYIRLHEGEMDRILDDNTSAAGRLISMVNIPCMIFEEGGRIVWRNPAMKEVYPHAHIKGLPAACHPKTPTQSQLMEFNNNAYQVVSLPIHRAHGFRKLIFQYWLNRTETEHYQRLYEEQMPYVALIYVDNYEELSADLQFHRNTVLTAVEKLISDMVASIDGIYRRYDNGRFLLVFEAKHLARLEKERFSLLKQAHQLDTGTDQTVTLSIAIGTATRIAQADVDARQAMELALGRGGDQAVVKTGANYAFYGGRKQLESGHSRVKTRLFAKALRQLMENSSEVYVMGHKQPDMDCIGSALGIVRCAMHVGCTAHIVLDQINSTIEQAFNTIQATPAYSGLVVSPEQVRTMIRPSSVLVIVDTQRAQSTIAPDLIGSASKLVLIDHHRRSADYIDNATLNYLDARASSASEMVCETIQYFDDGIRPTAFESSTLLAGITIDTKHFAFNVGARTFEAAAYLRHHGADISMVKLMFQDDRKTYTSRVDTVKSATILCPGIAVSVCPEDVADAPLIAAQAADALVGIRGIEAAFVLGREENGDVSISGRSLGSINVQLILERIGGGGHLTMAGAQLKGKSLDECTTLLKNTILEYMKETETDRR